MRKNIKTLLAGVAALLLATEAARANEFVVFLQKDNEKASVAFATMGMSCAEALESHERNRKCGTWLMYVPPGGGEPWRIVWIGCLSAVSKIHCPPNMVGKLPYHSLETPESGKTC
jgi:hypothetical protein